MCVWVEDADGLTIDSPALDVLLLTQNVRDYLDKKSSTLGIAGIKGQGKTFLIKVKRKKIELERKIQCLPYNMPVDILDGSFRINNSLYGILDIYNTWVNIWKFSFAVTLLNKEYDISKLKSEFRSCHERTQEILVEKNPKHRPSLIFAKLLKENKADLLAVLNDTNQLMSEVSFIRGSFCFFIDKLDQSFSSWAGEDETAYSERISRYWQYGQYALAQASYDILLQTGNSVKAYYTIRQEALDGVESFAPNIARNVNAYIRILSYSKSELEEMYNCYISAEDDKNLVKPDMKKKEPSMAFLGYSNIAHGNILNKDEATFPYIYRHTFQRPSDIMNVCRSLYGQEQKSIPEIRKIVNNQSDEIMEYYLSELNSFLPFSKENLETLMCMIPGTILDRDLIRNICSTFIRITDYESGGYCNKTCQNCNDSKLFACLYHLGLIGKLVKHDGDENYEEVFENIGKSLNFSERLPSSTFYFVHPALHNYSRSKRANQGMAYNKKEVIILGNGCLVQPADTKKIKQSVAKSKKILKQQRVFVSSTVNDLINERETVRQQLLERGMFPIMNEKDDFTLSNADSLHSHDLCIDEVRKCANLIFIIGEEYGGIYAGKKYEKYKEEIFLKSDKKICEPSISLMEFYAAKKNGIRYKIFRSTEIEKKTKEGKIDERIRTEVNFINHLVVDEIGETVVGNWMISYESLDDFKSRLSNLTFMSDDI